MSNIKIKVDVKKLPNPGFASQKKNIVFPAKENPCYAHEKPKTYLKNPKKCRGRIWTYDEEEKMLDGLIEGLSLEEIASQLNRTEEAVKNRIYRIKERGRAEW